MKLAEGSHPSLPSSLYSSRGSSSAASAAREAFFQPKDLVWLNSRDEQRGEAVKAAPGIPDPKRP
jgi:hypothetical protein